jgi:hypothetical protein
VSGISERVRVREFQLIAQQNEQLEITVVFSLKFLPTDFERHLVVKRFKINSPFCVRFKITFNKILHAMIHAAIHRAYSHIFDYLMNVVMRTMN